jgi:hypothetical protein
MSFQVPAGTGSHFDNSRVNIDYKTDLPDLKKGVSRNDYASLIEVEELMSFLIPRCNLRGTSQDNIMNE